MEQANQTSRQAICYQKELQLGMSRSNINLASVELTRTSAGLYRYELIPRAVQVPTVLDDQDKSLPYELRVICPSGHPRWLLMENPDAYCMVVESCHYDMIQHHIAPNELSDISSCANNTRSIFEFQKSC